MAVMKRNGWQVRRLGAACVVVVLTTGAGVARAAGETIFDEGGGGGGGLLGDGRAGAGGDSIFDEKGKPKPAAKPAAPAAKPVAVPGKTQQAAALELVKQAYATGLAKKAPADRAAVARQMLLQAQRSKDAAERYVLLSQARDVGASAGDVGIVDESIRSLAEGFTPVDVAGMKLEAMLVAAKVASDPKQCAAVAEELLSASEGALSHGALENAVTAVTRAEGPARKAQDAALSARVAVRKRELGALQMQFGGVPAAKQKLSANPNDPGANLLVGKFLCLVAGDFAGGVPHLAKGSDAVLRTAAELELKNASGGEAAAALGDAWYDAAAAQSQAALKGKARDRARYWYAKASPELSGLKKVRVENRIEELTPAPPPPPAETVAGAGNNGGKPGSTKPTTGSTKPAAGSAAASKTDPSAVKGDVGALNFVAGLIQAIPDNARPRTGTDTAGLVTYLGTANGRYKIDAVLKVVSAQLSSGGTYASISFEPVGPVTVGGVKYTLTLRISSENNQARAAAAQLGPGSEVTVRGSLQEYSITPGDGSVQVSAYLEAVQFAPGKMRHPK